MAIWRILEGAGTLQPHAYTIFYVAVGIVFSFDCVTFILLMTGYINFAAIFHALGNFVAYVASSYLPIRILREMTTMRMVSYKKTWGMLFCSCIAILAAVTSLALLALHTYQILLVCFNRFTWSLSNVFLGRTRYCFHTRSFLDYVTGL